MNPEYFDIEQLKTFGMWPNMSHISRGIAPYVRRLRKEKVSITIIGDNKGEIASDLYDLCGDKIEKIYSINSYGGEDANIIRELFDKNTRHLRENQLIEMKSEIEKGDEIDVLCIDEHACENALLTKVYGFVPSNGIFCGSGHDTKTVKNILNEFRRSEKIGTPIQVSNRSTWFWYKR
jgi:hypothetical protein